MRELETMLHGHLPACDERTGLVLVVADPRGRDRRQERAEQLLAAAARVGIRSAALTARPFAAGLTPAGQVPLPAGDALPPAAGALLAAAVPLQLLTLELAHARGTSPDLIRRHEAPYREAAAASKEV
jgi:glucosamine--fructose-6-phosphate aminotransferase (isomerizing)